MALLDCGDTLMSEIGNVSSWASTPVGVGKAQVFICPVLLVGGVGSCGALRLLLRAVTVGLMFGHRALSTLTRQDIC
jgi:hypothetical protein